MLKGNNRMERVRIQVGTFERNTERLMSETYVSRSNSEAFTAANLARAILLPSTHLTFTVLILVAYFLVWSFVPSQSFISEAFFAEDHVGEWLQFACCLATGIVAIRTFRLTSKKWLSAGIFFGGVGMIFVGAEEISWGQRVFNFQSSEYFFLMNHQGETNLHNLLPLESNLVPYYLAAFVIGVVLNTTGYLLAPNKAEWPWADMLISAGVMTGFYLFLPMSQHVYFYEYTELWIYSSILIFILRIRKNLLLEEKNRGVL